MIRFIFLLLILTPFHLEAQTDSLLSKLNPEMDFRFRAEQDWDSRKSDGSYRVDRTRLRYRFRVGATYQGDWYSMEFRIRTGDPDKQQDPQLTLGKGWKEFGTLPIGFEKIFLQAKWNNFKVWAGKNTYPFVKNNELFWSDNVFPEGVAISKKIGVSSEIIDQINLTAGLFILSSNDGSLGGDAYFHGLQTSFVTPGQRIILFPSIYIFRNIPDIPDGGHQFLVDYSIFHLGGKFNILNKDRLLLELDYYKNLVNYDDLSEIPADLQNQKSGYVIGLQYGKLKSRKDWLFKLTYAFLERYANLDYMAQNDWVRWDYSSSGSPDGRLSNFKGVELVTAYALTDKMNLVMKYYNVTQLIPYGLAEETGQRIRFDINVKL